MADLLNDLNPAHFRRLAEECDLGWPMVRERVGGLADRTMDVLKATEVRGDSPIPNIAARIAGVVQSRCERMLT